MRTTSPAARSLAHSVPAPKASWVAATDSVVDLPLSDSIRVIVPSPVFATQTEPGSIRETVLSRPLTTQTEPPPKAIPVGPLPT